MKFYQDYGMFIKEGVVTNEDPKERVCILFNLLLNNIVNIIYILYNTVVKFIFH